MTSAEDFEKTAPDKAMQAALIAEYEHKIARTRARGRMFMMLGLFAAFFIVKACTPDNVSRQAAEPSGTTQIGE